MKHLVVAALAITPGVILGMDGRSMTQSEKLEYMRKGRHVAQEMRQPPAFESPAVVPTPDVVPVMGPNLPEQVGLTPLPHDASESSSDGDDGQVVNVPANYTINIKNSHGKVKIINSPNQSPNTIRRDKKRKD